MSLTDITKAVTAAAESVPQNASEQEREALIIALDNLKDAVESPIQRAMRLMFSVSSPLTMERWAMANRGLQGFELIVLTLGVDMAIFDVIVKYSSNGETVSTEKLAEETKVERDLLSRLPRYFMSVSS
jgi:hypothetical protein